MDRLSLARGGGGWSFIDVLTCQRSAHRQTLYFIGGSDTGFRIIKYSGVKKQPWRIIV